MNLTLVDFLWAIPVFGILIFIHEMGHFLAAKYFGIRVYEFALGFGPVLLKFGSGETQYSLRAVPLGGFVRMAGMDESEDGDDPRGFNRKPPLARGIVIAAGPIMNFVLASLMFSALLFFSGLEPSQEPILGDVPAACQSMAEDGTSGPVTCPAYAAGLRAGDRVVEINGTPVKHWDDILALVKSSEGKPIDIQVQRGEETLSAQVEPFHNGERWMLGILGTTKREPLGPALVKGAVMTKEVSYAWIQGLTDIITGSVQAEFSGPVGITRMIAQEASRGWENLVFLTAFLSLNLGLFNLLPIPALDGSRLVFIIIEGIRGRRIDPQRENMVHFVGFLLLMGLILAITFKDVTRW